MFDFGTENSDDGAADRKDAGDQPADETTEAVSGRRPTERQFEEMIARGHLPG